MDANMNETNLNKGLPYDNITWRDIDGQPFGLASNFNAIVFEDANNIIDTSGAMAVGGNFYSPRGLSLGFGNDVNLASRYYSPDAVRFLVGGNITTGGPLVVVGHVLADGRFKGASGSTFFIGKDNMATQLQELEFLYQAVGGSPYWTPSDKKTHYLISSYDVPRYIPATRVGANVELFFDDARNSIMNYKDCITSMDETGTSIDNFHEWILRGDNSDVNVFVIDARPNGILNKGIRFDTPEESLNIVKLRTGGNAHIQYGLWGDERDSNRTLYVFEDANEIFMEVPAAIWGSVLAPQAMYHAHRTGGQITGNVALRSFAVNASSGFEFHESPFVGGLYCGMTAPTMPEEVEQIPNIIVPPIMEPEPEPEPVPIPEPEPIPTPEPMPTLRPTPAPELRPTPRPRPTPAPTCPECPPCPTCPECPPPEPAPTCPECPPPEPCPTCPECPPPQPAPSCPECPPPQPAPSCPECPKAAPAPACPDCPTCPECPPCPKAETYTEFIPLPVPIPYKEERECPECPPPLISPGIISGYVRGCNCSRNHQWEITLYQICNDEKELIYSEKISSFGDFEYEVPYDGNYMLTICPPRNYRRTTRCKPIIVLENIGVANFMIS